MAKQKQPSTNYLTKTQKQSQSKIQEWKRPEYRNARVKPVSTPYGDFPSALYAARALAPVLGVTEWSIRGMFKSKAEKWRDWYYIDDEKK